MSSTETNMAVEKFRKVAHLWVPFLDTMLVNAVALRANDGWHLRYANIHIYRDIANAPTPNDLVVQTASIYAIRSSKKGDTSEFLRVVDELAVNPEPLVLIRENEALPGFIGNFANAGDSGSTCYYFKHGSERNTFSPSTFSRSRNFARVQGGDREPSCTD